MSDIGKLATKCIVQQLNSMLSHSSLLANSHNDYQLNGKKTANNITESNSSVFKSLHMHDKPIKGALLTRQIVSLLVCRPGDWVERYASCDIFILGTKMSKQQHSKS